MKMQRDSFFQALKYSFSSAASRKEQEAHLIDENTADTEFRAFLLRAGMPQALLEQSALKAKRDGIDYRAQVAFVGGMTRDDALHVLQKVADSGAELVDAGTIFESDNRTGMGYLRLEMRAKNMAALRGNFGKLLPKKGMVVG